MEKITIKTWRINILILTDTRKQAILGKIIIT